MKPAKRAPKPRRPPPRSTQRIARKCPPRQQSKRPSAVERRRKDLEWADAVKSRTFGVCAYRTCCYVATDAHHLRTKKAHPELRWVLTNGIGLCRKHHNLAHKNMRAFREEFA